MESLMYLAPVIGVIALIFALFLSKRFQEKKKAQIG